MPTPTLTLPVPPKVLSGREIYDSIMSQIESELISSLLPTLKEKYKDETPEQKESRRKRYSDAFARYDELYVAYIADMETRIRRYKREAMRSIEEWARAREGEKLNDMAASLFDLP